MTAYIFKKHVKNCFICAIRPLIYAGLTITYIGKAKCPHMSNIAKPRIIENIFSTSLARFCNLFLVVDVFFVIFKILKSDSLSVSSKYYLNIILPNYVNTLNYTFCLLRNNSSYMKHTNCLIALIDKRKFFGIDSILTKKFTTMLQLWSLFWFCFIMAICLLFFVTTTPRELSIESVLLAVSMLVNNINAMAFSAYGMTTLMVYYRVFSACFDSIIKSFKEKHKKQFLVTTSLLNQLQYQQQFYISACCNYKKHVFGFGNVFFYTGQLVFTIFSVVQAYFSAFEAMDSEGYWFILFSKFYHIFLGVMSSMICIQINSIQLLNQDLVSFLYKYRINQLNTAESLQVEILLIALATEKPILTASNFYTIGINLLASVTGSAVTYVLVALQFQASFSTA